MERSDQPEWLTAAECAARTGLTTRALRVYEELGLIAPRRSASGWRQYCPDDLLRLNVIALLKTAGLTLAQIRVVTQGASQGPSLQQKLRPTSESDFELSNVDLPVSFDRKPDGAVQAFRLRMKGGDMTAVRVDADTAQQVRSRLAARIKARQPLAGSEDAVRELVEGLLNGHPNYERMHPALAHVARQQLTHLHTTAAYLGPIQSIEYQGVGAQGWDVYDVRHERGTSRVRIVLRSDGTMTGALFVVKDGPVTLGP